MRITDRDIQLLETIALHGVLTRDQTMSLGFFGSIPRANARLCPLTKNKLLGRVCFAASMSLRQSVYFATKRAGLFIEPRVAELLLGRKNTPRFIEHSLAVADVRIALESLGALSWFHECQVRHRYSLGNRKTEEFRPDALTCFGRDYLFVEVDRGHTSRGKLIEKFKAYDRYASLGLFQQTYDQPSFRLLVVTTGQARCRSIHTLGSMAKTTVHVVSFSHLQTVRSIGEVIH
jgi:hypothetical protein